MKKKIFMHILLLISAGVNELKERYYHWQNKTIELILIRHTHCV